MMADTSKGIMHQFRGEDGVDKWSGPLNFPTPERSHNRVTVTLPKSPFGGASIKVEIKPADPQWETDRKLNKDGKKPKRRAEFSWNRPDWRFGFRKEGWAGAAFFLPSNPMGNNNGTSIFQLHNFPEEGVLWNVFTNAGKLSSVNEPGGAGKRELIPLMERSITPYLDTWTRMIVNFKPSTGSDGFIKMWLNDELVINKTGRNKSSGKQGPFFKNGTYFWGYEKFDKKQQAVVYFDNLRIGDETSNHESVDPASW